MPKKPNTVVSVLVPKSVVSSLERLQNEYWRSLALHPDMDWSKRPTTLELRKCSRTAFHPSSKWTSCRFNEITISPLFIKKQLTSAY